MIEVDVSNWSSYFFVMKLLRFGFHKILFFCLRWKGPIFEPRKKHKKRPQFHKFYSRPFARSIFIPHERYRSVTPLGLTLPGSTGRFYKDDVAQSPWPFCARILYNPQRGRGKICMILSHVKRNKAKLSKNRHPYYFEVYENCIWLRFIWNAIEWWDEQNRCTYMT